MRAVIDTNVLIAGLLWRGAPHALLAQVRRSALYLVSSPALLAELAEVLDRPKFQSILSRARTTSAQLLAELRQLVEAVEPVPLDQPVCRDPDDDEVLAVAVTARVELIVSGDQDLLVLGQFREIPIVNPAEALQRISA